MKTIFLFFVTLLVFSFNSWALEPWTFNKTYESKRISENPFYLATTTDIKGNGTNEIITTDFGFHSEDVDHAYNLYIVKWQKNQLYVDFHKKWNRLNADKGFRAFKAMQLVPWKADGHITVETLPPYFAIEWKKGKYILNEQVWEPDYKNTIGSWALPWISPACYGFGKSGGPEWKEKARPRECVLGIRDFAGNGNPKIVSIFEEEIIKDKKYKQTLRVRSLKSGFPIEWQMVNPDRFRPGYIDPLNWKGSDKLLLFGFKNDTWYFLQQNRENKKYELKKTQIDKRLDIETFTLPYIYLRSTQSKGIEEYWGYHFVKGSDKRDIPVLGKDVLRTDPPGFDFQNIDFKHHEPYLGVIYFDAKDIDGDGIDEVIVLERTGKRKIGDESTIYSNVKEYIHILKWNGQAYQAMWVSPPYTKMGAKFLIDDIKNTGKKQLVVLAPYGAIQIWERQ